MEQGVTSNAMCQTGKAIVFCQVLLWIEIIHVNVANFWDIALFYGALKLMLDIDSADFLKLYSFLEDKQLSSSSQFLVRPSHFTKTFSEPGTCISGRRMSRTNIVHCTWISLSLPVCLTLYQETYRLWLLCILRSSGEVSCWSDSFILRFVIQLLRRLCVTVHLSPLLRLLTVLLSRMCL